MNRSTERIETGSSGVPASDILGPSVSPEPVLLDPQDVLVHPRKTLSEKRALLASWASDARAIKNSRTLRRLGSGAIIRLAEILETIEALDQTGAGSVMAQPAQAKLPPFARLGGRLSAKQQIKAMCRLKRDDEDDPPSAPALATMPRQLPNLSLSGDPDGLLPVA